MIIQQINRKPKPTIYVMDHWSMYTYSQPHHFDVRRFRFVKGGMNPRHTRVKFLKAREMVQGLRLWS